MTRLLLSVLLLLLPLWLTGCSDAKAKQEDARILAEFRGPHFIPADQRRLQPMAPPLVPHVVYSEDFNCLVCHGNQDFRFRGQRVKWCPHPERTACLQCHVPLQTKEEPFRFEMLAGGERTGARPAGGTQP
jgi:nitrate reductase cytochrome c-type subunit